MRNRLPRTSRVVYAVLRARADELGAASVSRRQLSEWTGRSDRGIRLAIQRLERAGLVEVEHNCGLGGQVLTNTYYVQPQREA